MLKGIPAIISPELLDVLMRMGHGDELVLADANFPSDTVARETVWGEAVSLTGAGTPEALAAVLKLLPLDEAVSRPAAIMAAPPELGPQPIHNRLRAALAAEGCAEGQLEPLDRFDFYARAREAFAVVRTGETAKYGNILIKKGVVSGC
jgi:L-fucose mutarotase